MTQTLKRELRLKFMEILDRRGVFDKNALAEELCDAAFQVTGISKRDVPVSLDWLIRGGASSDKIEELLTKEKMAKEATDTFERELAFNPLPWDSNAKWMRLKAFVAAEYRKDVSCFRYFSSKRKNEGQFSKLPANKRIYEDPDLLIAIWPSLKTQPETTKGEHLL